VKQFFSLVASATGNPIALAQHEKMYNAIRALLLSIRGPVPARDDDVNIVYLLGRWNEGFSDDQIKEMNRPLLARLAPSVGKCLDELKRSTPEALQAEAAAACRLCEEPSTLADRRQLGRLQPTPLERMTVGRLIACWVFAHFVDRWCGWSIKQGGRASDLAKLLEAAEKRYQTSLKSLALEREIELSRKRSRSNRSAAA
jgi:hypothetical protein